MKRIEKDIIDRAYWTLHNHLKKLIKYAGGIKENKDGNIFANKFMHRMMCYPGYLLLSLIIRNG